VLSKGAGSSKDDQPPLFAGMDDRRAFRFFFRLSHYHGTQGRLIVKEREL
jgi:hypothetical protein